MTLSRNAFFGILAGIAIVLIVAISITWHVARKSIAPVAQQMPNMPPAPVSPTRHEVPAGAVVPEINSTVGADVAKPQKVIAQAGGFNYRSFDIQVNGDKFIPEKIIVHASDDIYINFLAVDKNYDFKQPDNGFFGLLPKGQKRVLHGQFPATGDFLLYCESCGGPSKGPILHIIVIPK